MSHSATLPYLVGSLHRHASLIKQMVKRDVIGRYRGSLLGVVWSFFNPLIMLTVYSIVFTVVFKARWGMQTGAKGEFAIILFAGLIVHALLAECFVRAPSIITSQSNFVKKVVFPLEILVPSVVGAALFHFCISFLVLVLGRLAVYHALPWTIVCVPLLLLPFIIFLLGCSWFLAALGVYVRDVAQVMGILMTVMLFLSPVFYPMDSLPPLLRMVIYLNPLSFIVEQMRTVIIAGKMLNWYGWGLYMVVGLITCWVGFVFFQKTRKGFADVL